MLKDPFWLHRWCRNDIYVHPLPEKAVKTFLFKENHKRQSNGTFTLSASEIPLKSRFAVADCICVCLIAHCILSTWIQPLSTYVCIWSWNKRELWSDIQYMHPAVPGTILWFVLIFRQNRDIKLFSHYDTTHTVHTKCQKTENMGFHLTQNKIQNTTQTITLQFFYLACTVISSRTCKSCLLFVCQKHLKDLQTYKPCSPVHLSLHLHSHQTGHTAAVLVYICDYYR